MVTRRRGVTKLVLFASHEYIRRGGKLEGAQDLKSNVCVMFGPWSTGNVWTLVRG